ncbi:hypothetical protein SISSUDRAFT_1068147 [Sistotremastrum suecicum HHB10207 ss-3]|uniref:Uncharacterized protein n=1 Tax=Sistotremastrum suecicum HHB10207 ss-3 TaxID=1314776 RepID=A0A165WEX2_9AGAM|nr:hypothetical protein SISSUDRAFT_1068147 [Sistotremastrum suecicum HHB10207 ss-3]
MAHSILAQELEEDILHDQQQNIGILDLPADNPWRMAYVLSLDPAILNKGLILSDTFLTILGNQILCVKTFRDDLPVTGAWVIDAWGRRQPTHMCKAFMSHPDYRSKEGRKAAITAALSTLDLELRLGGDEMFEQSLFPETIMWCAFRMTVEEMRGELWEYVAQTHHYNLVTMIEQCVERIYVAKDKDSSSEQSSSGSEEIKFKVPASPQMEQDEDDAEAIMDEDEGYPFPLYNYKPQHD